MAARWRGTRPARPRPTWTPLFFGLALLIAAGGAPVAAEPPVTVEGLLKDGWEIAGYTGTLDNRSTVILFRHKDKTYLVQCSVLYDVTRTPRVNTNCYDVR